MINITNGDIFNDYIKKKVPGFFIPFKEAMIEKGYDEIIFSDAFINQRIKTHKTTKEDYLAHMKLFFEFIANPTKYQTINLWFGNDEFCLSNLLVILAYFKQNDFKQEIYLYPIIDEYQMIYKDKVKIDVSDFDKHYTDFLNNSINLNELFRIYF